MRKIISILFFIAILYITIEQLVAQPPPPPTNSGSSSGGGQSGAVGGSAPIGGGLFILLSLGVAYGGKKIYDLRKEELEE